MFRVRYTAMRTILLRAPVAFQVVRFIATPHSYHPSILEKETSSVLYRTSTSVIRKALPFGSIPSWRAWTSTAIMAAPAGDDFKSTEWIGGEAHEVMPKVFLGSMEAASDKESMKNHSITHVLTVNGREPLYKDDFKYKVINIGGENGGITPHLNDSMKFVEDAVNSGGVLIHCTHGTGRSAAMAIAAVMKSKGGGTPGGIGSFDEAFRIVKARRPGTDPPMPFQKELADWKESKSS